MQGRIALEQPRSLDEMRALLDGFAADREGFPDATVRRRRGLAKDIIEEYEPLYRLARELEGFASARLTAESLSGPDAIIQLNDGSGVTVQITTAGETASTALQRELLAQGEPVFTNQHASRLLPSKRTVAHGRALTSKRQSTERMIEEVKAAIQRKASAYRSGTDYLLILIRQSSLSMETNWTTRLSEALSNVVFAPYSAVYVTNTKTCVRCAGA